MNKKCTLLAAVCLAAGVWTAKAATAPDQPVASADWTTGNYYFLRADGFYLSLDGNKADSVIVKSIDFGDVSRAALDSALWEITAAGTANGGNLYQFKNKKTQAVLSFSTQTNQPVLGTGVSKWSFNRGEITGAYNGGTIGLSVKNGKLELGTSGSTTSFTVLQPDAAVPLTAEELGNGFQLTFTGDYQDNVFAGKKLLPRNVGTDGFVTLQITDDASYPDGKAKYIRLDTVKTAIQGAQNVFGYTFKVDSMLSDSIGKKLGQFRFTIDLVNDSLAIYVAGAPEQPAGIDTLRMVGASVDGTNILTVSGVQDGRILQGTAPSIRLTKGQPATIPTGSGVYFLKKAEPGAGNGQYILSYSGGLQLMGDSVPTENVARGQWLIKETDGKYSIVDRFSNTALLLNGDVYAVEGMANTYMFGSLTDSITIEHVRVNVNDRYLGSLYFTESELADNGYVLSQVSGSGVNNLYAFAADSMLQIKNGAVNDALSVKLIPNDTVVVGGARQLGDTLSVISYKMKLQFENDSVMENLTDPQGLKISSNGTAVAFRFFAAPDGLKYGVMSTDGRVLTTNPTTSYLQLATLGANQAAYFNLVSIDAPAYGDLQDSHRRIGADGLYLTMNPLNFLAEMKTLGQDITKASYEADNFSLWVEKADTVIAGKSLYYISSALRTPGATVDPAVRYYLASLRDSNTTVETAGRVYYRVGFITGDTIKTMKNSPALFAFKTAESGDYYLENQSELNRTTNDKTPYVGVVNGFVVLQAAPASTFAVETTNGPTANEAIGVSDVTVVAGTGTILIRNAAGKQVTLSNILGKTIGSTVISSDQFTMPAGRGIVVVSIEDEPAQKVLVK